MESGQVVEVQGSWFTVQGQSAGLSLLPCHWPTIREFPCVELTASTMPSGGHLCFRGLRFFTCLRP